MGMACVAENWENDSKGQFREMIHDEVDRWVDELWEEFGEDRQPTLMELSEIFTRTRQKFLGVVCKP